MQIKTLTSRHLLALHEFTSGYGWPHTLEDLEFALKTGRGYAALDGDELLGTCFTWKMGEHVSTLGLLVVSAERQGQGIGRALLRQALDDLRDRAVLLHATPAGLKLYQQEGFTALGEVRQFQGMVKSNRAASGELEPVTPELMETILHADRDAMGYDRSAVLGSALRTGHAVSNGPGGFAVIRPFGRGHVIGPVVAHSAKEARVLIEQVLCHFSGSFVRVDVTDALSDASWMEDWGLSQVDTVLAMSNAPLPGAKGTLDRYALIGHAYG